MSKRKNADECPRCGSKYLDLKYRKDSGEIIATCEDCGHEFKAYGKPGKKHNKPNRTNNRHDQAY